MRATVLKAAAIAALLGLLAAGAFIAAAFFGGGARDSAPPGSGAPPEPPRTGDGELAYLLVKLALRTRAVMAGHYTRSQSRFPGVDLLYQRTLAKNGILPAAVADAVFSGTVPSATGGRAWVKMVVAEPRNPNNRGDATALELFAALRAGAPRAEREGAGARYYAEPIVANASCLPCHGAPRGAPDPLFPRYKKDGWRAGEVVGAVVARVAPAALR